MDAASITAIFAGAIGVMTLFFAFMRWIVVRLTESFDKNTQATADMMKSQREDSKKALTLHKKVGDQAEIRNGHLAEIQVSGNLKILEAIAKLPSIEIANQSVDNQTVKHQTIKE